MKSQTIDQAKESLVNEVIKLLERNMKDVQKNNYRIHNKTKIGKGREMFTDIVWEKILNKYMPITYDEIIAWTKQEPLLIERPMQPCFYREGEDSIIAIIRSNIGNYLKQYVYKNVRAWLYEKRRSY